MQHAKDIAQYSTEIAIGLVAFSTGTATGIVPFAVAGVTLSAIGATIWSSCADRACRRAVTAVLKDMQGRPGITDATLARAAQILKDAKGDITLDPSALARVAKDGPFPDHATQLLLSALPFGPQDVNARSLIEIAINRAVTTCLDNDTFDKGFKRQLLLEAARGQGVMLTLLDAIKDDTAAIRAGQDKTSADLAALQDIVDALRTRLEADKPSLSPFARTLLDNEAFIVSLAFRYAEGNPSDFDAALRGLERALNVAAEERQRGQLPANTDEAVNAVLADVDVLNDDGQIDDAAALIAEEEACAQAGLTRLYDKGIAQAILTRDATAACAYELKKLPLDIPDPAGQFDALRAVWRIWYERGLDKGLNFDLEVAIGLAQATRARAIDADQRGHGGNDLGLALWSLGAREPGPDRLEQAVVAYRAALEEWTRDRVPLAWAATQNNLGATLKTLGERESGTDRLEQAVTAYRAALEEGTRDRVPLDWATTQNNLGAALVTLGEREPGTDRLQQAVVAYRAALKEWTRDRVPLAWAATQNNLGATLKTLGERESGTDRLEQAVTAYRAALEEGTRDRVPLDWATTQNNLGAALVTLGEREPGTDRLQQAVVAYRAALKERTRDRVPLDWAMTQNNLGNALLTLGAREPSTDRLEQAVTAFRAALEEYTRDRVPLNWAGTQNNLGVALSALGEREPGTDNLNQAVTAYRAALEERTRDRVPLDWAMTQNNLGNALLTLGAREPGTERLQQAVTAYRAALEEHTRERVPLKWAATQNNLGNALRALGAREPGTERLQQAVTAYRAALDEWTRDRVPLDWAGTTTMLARAEALLADRLSDKARAQAALSAAEAAQRVLRDGGHAKWAGTARKVIEQTQAILRRLSDADASRPPQDD